MPQLRVLLTDRAWPNWDLERRILAEVGAEIIEAPDGDEATLALLAVDADAIGVCWAEVTERVIEAAARCRGIARFGIGLDNIALPAASARDIPVTYVPDYCVEEVADHAMALLLACARNIGFFHQRTKRGEYDLQAASSMPRLRGSLLGLVGLGRIGQAMAERARAFGMEVIAHTQSGNAHGSGCRMVALDTLLEQSDFVSLHCPLTSETRGLLALAQFERMKESAYLINTARGAVVDPGALEIALSRNEIAGAALDVFDPEPPDLSQPFYQNERLLVTPHASFLSSQSLVELRTRTARQLADMLQGRRPEHLVNPHIWHDRT